VELVRDIKPAGQIIAEMLKEATHLIERRLLGVVQQH
jgi:hypothetical protein